MVEIGIQGQGTLPVQTNTSLQEMLTQQDNGTGFQQNRFTPQQQQMQGQALSGLSGLLSGQSAPQSMGLPQSSWDYAVYQWNKVNAPTLAAQHGAGSPAMAGSLNELLMGLASESGKMAMSNTLNAYNVGAEYAFKPVGQDEGEQNNMLRNRTLNQTETGIDYGGALGFLTDTLGQVLARTFP